MRRLTFARRVMRSRMGAIGDYLDHHATILVAWEVAGPIEAGRQDWDPGMAARIAAHVTVAYPQEAPIAICWSSGSKKPARESTVAPTSDRMRVSRLKRSRSRRSMAVNGVY
jgi:hypothetical protein